MSPGNLIEAGNAAVLHFTLPCAACGACVPFVLEQNGAQLLCPQCGVNIHVQDRHSSVARAEIICSNSGSFFGARAIRRRLRRLVQL